MDCDRPRVLVAVEPELLGLLLAEILELVGEDQVSLVTGAPAPGPARPFSAAVVSGPCGQEVADVVIVVPGPGHAMGEVHTGSSTVTVDMRAPLAMLEVLDRYCPAGRCRTAALRAHQSHAPDGQPDCSGGIIAGEG